MAIHISNPQGRIAEMLGMSLGESLGNGINTYFANKALDDVVNDKSLSNASTSAKMGKLQSALAPYGEVGQKLFKNRIDIENQLQQEREEKVLSQILGGKEITSDEFSALSPKTQMDLMRYQQQQAEAEKKRNTDTLASQSFSKGYRAIVDNDLNALKEVISDPETPLNVKTQLGNIQNQFSTRNDVKAKEVRNRVNSVQNAYTKAIAAERNKIGKEGGLRKAEVAEINQRIDALEKARQQDMQTLLKNPETFGSLQIWGNDQMKSFLPDVYPEQVEEGNVNQDFEEQESGQSKFKLETDEQRKNVARMLLRKHKGNKEKAMQEYEETYE